jgi:hypothetical protein
MFDRGEDGNDDKVVRSSDLKFKAEFEIDMQTYQSTKLLQTCSKQKIMSNCNACIHSNLVFVLWSLIVYMNVPAYLLKLVRM